MLTRLSIRDVVLIETLDLEFGPGLGVLTGETGAGKSILLDALGLALGQRAESGLVRAGQPQAFVSVSFDLPPDHAAFLLLDEQGLAHEPADPLVIRRQVKADGGSRAFVNDQPVSAGFLRELGSRLVEIHGQHDDRGLLNARGHRALLDTFGRLETGPVQRAWEALRMAEERLERFRLTAAEAQRDREWLIFSVEELGKLDPQPGEEEELAGVRATMQAGARLGEELGTIHGHLGGSDGALAGLRQAARRLDRIAADHELLAQSLAAIDRAVIEAAEAEELLDRAQEALAFDPARLDAAEARLFDIRAMARKHRVEADALPALRDSLAERLAAVEAGDEQEERLQGDVAEARAVYAAEAERLSEARRAAAARLDLALVGEFGPLKLDAARFRTAVEPAEPGPSGRDKVEFLVSTNPGADFAPLVRIASGGELSRFILALKVALAEEGGAGTMIFDEIDRGVGGAVASAIGERLHRLSAQAQTLVVTHSPQVAARGARHLLIEKSHDGFVTRTSVAALDPVRRREEIARMLSGAEITEEARAQAGRLLEAA